MKLRVYLSLFSALAILTVSTGCIISHCTTPAAGGAPAAAVRPGLEQELKKDVLYLAKTCHPRPAGYEKNQARAVQYIARSLSESGAAVTYQPFTADKRTLRHLRKHPRSGRQRQRRSRTAGPGTHAQGHLPP